MESRLTSEAEVAAAKNQSDVGDDATALMFDLKGLLSQENHEKAMSDARRDYEANANALQARINRSEEHTSELQSH